MAFKKVENDLYIGTKADLPHDFSDGERVFFTDTEDYCKCDGKGNFEHLPKEPYRTKLGNIVFLVPKHILKHLSKQ